MASESGDTASLSARLTSALAGRTPSVGELREYLGRVGSPDDVEWSDAEDLRRLGMETLTFGQEGRRTESSNGALRLAGPGVRGHAAGLVPVADTLKNFQRFITAIGASLEGHRSLIGKLPVTVRSLLELDIAAAPAPGSLVFSVVPRTLATVEVTPDSELLLRGDDPDQAVDRAIADGLDLLRLAKSAGPSDESSGLFAAALQARGPRVAATLRDLSRSLSAGSFEPDFAWRRPRASTNRLSLSLPEVAYLTQMTENSEVAHETAVVEGVVATVSRVAPLRLEVADGEHINIETSAIAPDLMEQVHLGMRLSVEVSVDEATSSGGHTTFRYTAQRLTLHT